MSSGGAAWCRDVTADICVSEQARCRCAVAWFEIGYHTSRRLLLVLGQAALPVAAVVALAEAATAAVAATAVVALRRSY